MRTQGLRAPRVAHVVRRYGGVTEPFIEQRIGAAGQVGELWYERLDRPYAGRSRCVRVPLVGAGSVGDRLLHRLPGLRRITWPAYRAAERESAPEVIHAHYLTTGCLIGGGTQAPLVVSAYGFDVTLIPRRILWRRVIRANASRLAAVLVEGPHMAHLVADLGIAQDRVHVVPIAASLEGIVYQERQAAGPLRLMTSGRMVEKKGLDISLRAFARALPTLPPGTTLDVIGDGPMRAELLSLADLLGVAQRVTFHGLQPRRSYLKLLSRAHVVLAPSRTAANGDGEGGAPTTILDAQASGAIVVGSTHADIPFLVTEGETGFLAAEGDSQALSDAILRAVGSASRWRRIGAQARAQIEARHSDDAVARQLQGIHASLA